MVEIDEVMAVIDNAELYVDNAELHPLVVFQVL
jgi:hypothetical protein